MLVLVTDGKPNTVLRSTINTYGWPGPTVGCTLPTGSDVFAAPDPNAKEEDCAKDVAEWRVSHLTKAPAVGNPAKTDPIKLVAVGIGDSGSVDEPWLNEISKGSFYRAANYSASSLQLIVDDLVRQSCADISVNNPSGNQTVTVNTPTNVTVAVNNPGSFPVDTPINMTINVGPGLTITGVTQGPGSPPVASPPDVGISRDPINLTVPQGQTVNYTITVTNVGSGPATNVVINETLPPGLQFAGGYNAPPGTYRPSAVVSATGDATPGNNGPVNSTITVTPVNPDVGITSTPGPLTSTVGSPVSFNITVTNTGQAPATNVTVTETLPPGLIFPPGWTAPAGCSTSGQVLTCNPGTIPVGVTVNIPVQRASDVVITKLPTNGSVLVNQPFSYNITLTNIGQAPATNVTMVETLPNGLAFTGPPPQGCVVSGQTLTCTPSSPINPGSVVTYPVQVQPSQPGTFITSATVTADGDVNQANNGPANNSITAVLLITDLAISITPPTSPVLIGQPVPITITVVNVGNATSGNGTITIPLPLSVPINPTSVPPGGNITYTLVITPNAAGNFTATANSTTPGDVDPGNNWDSATLTVVRTCGSFTSTGGPYPCATGSTLNSAAVLIGTVDVSITKSPASIATTVGSSVSYLITVRNQGTLPANNVVITDTLPAEVAFAPSFTPSGCSVTGQVLTCNRSSIPVGGSVNITVQVVPTQAGAFTTNGSVTATADANTANNGPATVTIVATEPVLPDVRVTKTGPAGSVLVGQAFTFTLVVNVADAAAANVKVQDVLPPGLQFTSKAVPGCTKSGNALNCNLGNLAAGAIWSTTVEVTATTAGPIANTATVNTSSSQPPGSTSNDQSISVVNVLRELQQDVASRLPHPKTLYDSSKASSKPAAFSNCCVGTCANTNPSNPSPVRQTCSPGFQYNPAADNQPNPTPSVCCIRVVLPDVSIVSTGPTTAQQVGQPFNFTWVVNNADAAANAVTVTGSLPAGLQFTSKPVPGCTKSGAALSCSIGNMQVGGTFSTTFEVVSTKAGPYTVNGLVTTTSTESNTANNFDGASVTVVDPPAAPDATCADSLPTGVRNTPVPCASRGTLYDASKASGKFASFADCCLPTCFNTDPSSASPVPQTCLPGTTFDPQNNLTVSPTPQVCCRQSAPIVQPDVSVTIDGPPKATVGTPFALNISVEALKAPSTGVANVTVVYELPSGIQFTDNPVQGGCIKSNSSLICTYPADMPVGTVWNINVQVVASRTGGFTNVARVTAESDTNPLNNVDSSVTTVVAAGTCTNAFTCFPGTVANPAAANSTTLTFASCCLATCSNVVVNSSLLVPFTCSSNTIPRNTLSTTVDEATCCRPRVAPTCGNVLPDLGGLPIPYSACPQFTAYNPNTSNVTPPNGPNCCTKTCGNIGATSPPVSYASQCSGSLPAFNPDASWNSGPNEQPDRTSCCTTGTTPSSTVAVSITKTSTVTSVNIGQEFDFTLRVAVSALDPGAVAKSVVVVDTLPVELEFVQPPRDPRCRTFGLQMTCSMGDLEDGSYPIVVSVVGVKAGAGITNIANVIANNDNTNNDNTGTKQVTVLGACCDLNTGGCAGRASAGACNGTFAPDKTCDQAQCAPRSGTCGDTVPGSASPVPFSSCPSGTVYNSNAASQQPANRQNCCLPTCSNTIVDSDVPIKFTCSDGWQYNPDAASKTTLTNPECCEKSAPPQAVPDVSITKRVNRARNLAVGAQITYTLTVKVESGTGGIDDVVVRDPLPASLDFVSARTSKTGGKCSSAGLEIVCQLGTMALNEVQTVTINALTTRAGNYLNTADVTGTGDSDASNNRGNISISVLGHLEVRGVLQQRLLHSTMRCQLPAMWGRTAVLLGLHL
eukprot:gene8269-8457_t